MYALEQRAARNRQSSRIEVHDAGVVTAKRSKKSTSTASFNTASKSSGALASGQTSTSTPSDADAVSVTNTVNQ